MAMRVFYSRRNSIRLLFSGTKSLVSKMNFRQRKAADNSCQSDPLSCRESADRNAIERAEDEGMSVRAG